MILAHQWLAQLGSPDHPIREAIISGPNLRVVFRLRDPREAAQLAEAVVPLDLEQPVKALVKPTVVSHDRTWFGNVSAGTQQSQTHTVGVSISHSSAETHSEGVSESEGESHSVTVAESTSESSSQTVGVSEAEHTDTSRSFDLDPSNPLSEATVLFPAARAVSNGTAAGTSITAANARGTASSIAETDGWFRSTTRSASRSQSEGRSVGRSNSQAQMAGTSFSAGASEGLQPVFAELPSAVHGKENVFYFAARELLSLQTGHARMAYVARAATAIRRCAFRWW